MTDLPVMQTNTPTEHGPPRDDQDVGRDRDPLALAAMICSGVSLIIPVAWLFDSAYQPLVAFLFALCGAAGIALGMMNLRLARVGEAGSPRLSRAAVVCGLVSIGFFLCFLALVVREIILGPTAVFREGSFQFGGMIAQGINYLTTHYLYATSAIASGIQQGVQYATEWLLFYPPWLMVFLFAALAWWISRRKGVALFALLGLALMWNLGFWQSTMQTLVLVIFSTIVAVAIGLPIGVVAAIWRPVQWFVRPILDFMQTLPAFVYLIPAVAFFAIGSTPAIFATVIFSMPPCVRLTVLGIRQVPTDLVEAADAFGSTTWQKLIKLQIPVAAPAIRQGINQTIMLALSMVVIAGMVGAPGLGSDVFRAITQDKVALGFNAGIGIVILAIILDRVMQSAGSKA